MAYLARERATKNGRARATPRRAFSIPMALPSQLCCKSEVILATVWDAVPLGTLFFHRMKKERVEKDMNGRPYSRRR